MKAFRSDTGHASSQGPNILSTNHRAVETGGWVVMSTVPNICYSSPWAFSLRGSPLPTSFTLTSFGVQEMGVGVTHAIPEPSLQLERAAFPSPFPPPGDLQCPDRDFRSVSLSPVERRQWAQHTQRWVRNKPLSLKTTEVWASYIVKA